METSRTPPQNLEAEQSVLGSILIDNEAFITLEGSIESKHFYKQAHRIIFEACDSLRESNEPVDLVTLTEELRQNNKLESVGNVPYLIGLAEGVPTAAYVQNYAKIVLEKYKLREMISVGGQLQQSAYDEVASADEIAIDTETNLLKITSNTYEDNFELISNLTPNAYEALVNPDFDDAKFRYFTGFTDLDKQLDGFVNGQMTGLAARPSMGKSSGAFQIAEHIAKEYSAPVGIVSLEMKKESVTKRMLASGARVDTQRAKNGQLTPRDIQRIADYSGELSQLPIHIDDTRGLSAKEIRAKVVRLVRKHDVKFVIIDHMHHLRFDSDNLTVEIDKAMHTLQALAGDLDIHILILMQLSRAVESRPNKRPMLSDLRQSGAIEQILDTCIFLYRDEYYDPHTEDKSIAEWIIGKQRSGPTGTVKTQWHSSHVRFNNLAQEPETDKKQQAKQNNQAQNRSQDLDNVYRGDKDD